MTPGASGPGRRASPEFVGWGASRVRGAPRGPATKVALTRTDALRRVVTASTYGRWPAVRLEVGRRSLLRRSPALLLVSALLAAPAPARGDTLTFTGSFSRDWNTAANWTEIDDADLHAVPSAGDDVQIPFGTAPALSTGADGAAASIALDAGASLSVSGRALRVAGAAPSTLDGDVDLTAATLQLAGASSWGGGDWSLRGATVTNAGALRITGDVAAV